MSAMEECRRTERSHDKNKCRLCRFSSPTASTFQTSELRQKLPICVIYTLHRCDILYPRRAGRCSGCNTAGRVRVTSPPPSCLNRLLSVVDNKWKAAFAKDRQKSVRKYFGHFFAQVKIVGQSFWVFREWRTSLRKTFIISGTMIGRTNPKTA